MADKPSDLSEKIADQIARIAKESVRIDLEILQFLKEDFEEIRKAAKEEGLSAAGLLAAILDGIRKGLARGGVESLAMARSILGRSEKEWKSLQKAWHERHGEP
ncbi:hypothetical protein [Hydrogenimonas sp.]